MRSTLSQRHRAALLLGFAAFMFFTLAWYFAAHFTLGAAVGLALIMGVASGTGIMRLSR